MAAERATQYALIWFSFVIWLPTTLINLGPNKNNPNEIPAAPITITQRGIEAADKYSPVAEA